jgi:hypothetical protein
MPIYPLSLQGKATDRSHMILYDKPWYVGQLGRERGFEGISSRHCRRDEIRYNLNKGTLLVAGNPQFRFCREGHQSLYD